jgi:hypothetical protein
MVMPTTPGDCSQSMLAFELRKEVDSRDLTSYFLKINSGPPSVSYSDLPRELKHIDTWELAELIFHFKERKTE